MPIVLAGLLLAFLVMLLFGGTELDLGLLLLLHQPDSPLVDRAAGLVATAASPALLVAASSAGAGVLLVKGDWRRGLLLLAIPIGGLLLTDYMAGLAEPLRPPLSERVLPTQRARFPSPIAAGTVAAWLSLALIVARYRPWRGVGLAVAAVLIMATGLIQLVAGAAWPSDVIGGWAWGLFWTLLLLWLAGEELDDGTPRPVRHSFREGETYGEPAHRDRSRD